MIMIITINYYYDIDIPIITVLGKNAPRGQEMCDHYMGPLNQHALRCVQAIQVLPRFDCPPSIHTFFR